MIDGINKSIVLMGCKHCGKSTQGRLLAEKLGVPFVDTDDEIGRLRGVDFRTLYKTKGAAEFVLAEEEACTSIIKKNPDSQLVIATGGGICDNPPALQALRVCGTFVFLRLDIKYSVKRIMDKIEETEMGTFLNVPAYVMDKNPASLKEIEEINSQIDDILSQILRLQEDKLQQQQRIRDIQLQYYQIQIRPHFILNCLNTINMLAENKSTQAASSLIRSFSSYFRYVFRDQKVPVTVRDELREAKEYCNIYSIQGGVPILLNIEANEDVDECTLPILGILTFVENSIKNRATIHA